MSKQNVTLIGPVVFAWRKYEHLSKLSLSEEEVMFHGCRYISLKQSLDSPINYGSPGKLCFNPFSEDKWLGTFPFRSL